MLEGLDYLVLGEKQKKEIKYNYFQGNWEPRNNLKQSRKLYLIHKDVQNH